MTFDELSPELKEKVKAASSPEEVLTLAKQEGYELSEEELSGVAGGWCPADGCYDMCLSKNLE